MDSNKIWLESEGLRFLIMKDTELGLMEKLPESDAVIISYSSKNLTSYIVDTIRISEEEIMYLKPVFILNKTGHALEYQKEMIDLEILTIESSISLLTEKVKEIKEYIAKMDAVSPLNFESLVINKMLRYFYSREIKNVVPVSSPATALGYYYPMASLHSDQEGERTVLDVLKVAEEEGYMTGDYMESVYLCNHCSNGFLHYREVCPKCISSHLQQEDLVHHFPCAHIGPFSDFQDELNKNDLQCPKCNKMLKHIGVDYDKPSVIYTCKSCEHICQDAPVYARCNRCHKDTEVEHLLHRTVKKYHITSKGFYTALHGISSTEDKFSAIEGTVNINMFKVMLQYEIERMKIAKIESNLVYIHINNATDLYLKIGKDSKMNLLSELVRIIRTFVRPSDIVAFESSSTLLFSLNESKHDDALQISRKISILIRKLIRDNFNGFQAEVIYKVHSINKEKPHLEQLNSLTAVV